MSGKNKTSSRIQVFSFLGLGFLLILSCSRVSDSDSRIPAGPETEVSGTVGIQSVAQNIIYDVEVVPPYPDDPWMEECLKDLDHASAVDFIFKGLYEGRFEAYDIFGGNRIRPGKIRKMEENGEFKREEIGKFQFKEEWLLDTTNMSFSKQVTEIRLGTRKLDEKGAVINYAPLFRVVL